MVNEDTRGNVGQLQAEVRKLKEQLANALSQAGVIEVTPSDQQTGIHTHYRQCICPDVILIHFLLFKLVFVLQHTLKSPTRLSSFRP